MMKQAMTYFFLSLVRLPHVYVPGPDVSPSPPGTCTAPRTEHQMNNFIKQNELKR